MLSLRNHDSRAEDPKHNVWDSHKVHWVPLGAKRNPAGRQSGPLRGSEDCGAGRAMDRMAWGAPGEGVATGRWAAGLATEANGNAAAPGQSSAGNRGKRGTRSPAGPG